MVVWQLAKAAGLSPFLVHVADGLLEYESNWRMNDLLHGLEANFAIGTVLYRLLALIKIHVE